MRIAILDDYQQVALRMADWSTIPGATEITAFREQYKTVTQLKTSLKNFNVIVAMRERTIFSRELLVQLPDLRLLVTTGMRNASIDLPSATELGIPVCGTRGGGPATSELAWGLILSLLRHIPQEYAAVREGKWQSTLGVELQGKTLGLLGLGNLGSHMAVIGKAFGMSIIAWSQNLIPEKATESGARLVTMDELFSNSDILSVHLQLSDRTRGLVGTQELALMKPSAYFINTSRGPIVDRSALIKAIESRTIAGAGFDVYNEEPLLPDDPIRKLDNVILTPHLGFVTRETYTVFYRDAVEDIQAYTNNQPIRLLNPDVLNRIRPSS
jgi:phosphoglycerate dehydrogenase-like enzyme